MIVLGEADIQSLIASTDPVALAAEAYRLSASAGTSAAFRGNPNAQDPARGCLFLAGSAGPASLSIKSNVHFEGFETIDRAAMTFVRGRLAAENGSLVASAGQGRPVLAV